MDQKEAFKGFVRKNPKLIKYVKSGEMSWQKFYEIYSLYGEDNSAWSEYLKEEKAVATGVASSFGLAEALNWIKSIDLDSVQTGVNNIQRVLGVLQDFSKKDETTSKETYKPRPLYRHFED